MHQSYSEILKWIDTSGRKKCKYESCGGVCSVCPQGSNRPVVQLQVTTAHPAVLQVEAILTTGLVLGASLSFTISCENSYVTELCVDNGTFYSCDFISITAIGKEKEILHKPSFLDIQQNAGGKIRACDLCQDNGKMFGIFF